MFKLSWTDADAQHETSSFSISAQHELSAFLVRLTPALFSRSAPGKAPSDLRDCASFLRWAQRIPIKTEVLPRCRNAASVATVNIFELEDFSAVRKEPFLQMGRKPR